jgi:hypothetical protein
VADVRLESYAGEVLEFPDVCMQCGAPSTVRKRKNFSWFPPWTYLPLFCGGLPVFLIVALIMTKRRTVAAPLCEEHKNHWLWRQLLVVGSLVGVIGVCFLAAILNDDQGNDPLSGLLCAGSLILLVIWVILAAIVQSTAIRVKEITDSSITLAGVAPAFVEAYEEEWRISPDRLDDSAREYWNADRRGRRGDRPADDDRIQSSDEDEERQQPPDAFQEGTR